jgi:hypothetical protein
MNRNMRIAASQRKGTFTSFLLLTVLTIFLLSECAPVDRIMGLPPIYDYYYGVIDKAGKIIIEPKFKSVSNFSEGLAEASGKFNWDLGYIDRTGHFVIEPLFRKAWPFSEGLACVQRKDYKYCFIDKTGLTVVEIDLRDRKWGTNEIRYMSVDGISSFYEGLARVHVTFESIDPNGVRGRRQGWGYIDKTGRFLIEPVFVEARDFQEGVAAVCGIGSEGKPDPLYGFVKKWGYLNKKSRIVRFRPNGSFAAFFQVPLQFHDAYSFCDGLAQVYNDKDQRGYIDKKGNLLIDWFSQERRLDLDYDFREGLAVVGSMGKCGYMNKKGTLVIPFQFQSAKPFYEGLAAVKVNELWGYIDKNGKMVVLPRFSEASPFSDGLAWVGWGKEMSGYINRNGDVVIQLPAGSVGSMFSEGLARVSFRQPRS